MKNAITQALDESMFADNLSARHIIKRKLESMIKYPASYKAQELEEMGYSVDYKEGDEGNDPQIKNI